MDISEAIVTGLKENARALMKGTSYYSENYQLHLDNVSDVVSQDVVCRICSSLNATIEVSPSGGVVVFHCRDCGTRQDCERVDP
jgi:translation initiation factor 2 beta subunit (eIF-2beta)/eIF-5